MAGEVSQKREMSECLMPAVHSRQVRSVRFSSESYSRRGCASVTLYTLVVCSQFTRECRLKQNYQKSETTAKWDTRLFDLGIVDRWKSESWRGETLAPETIREHPRRGECFHLHSRSRIVSGSLGESVQTA